ncbi:proline-rich proteoglycan 2-like [Hyaena hyaena]|uniref:proline-rich proteoglycan 2-like n=1 Tax=Hyaena hyaena TaxID=95912 RepID=UPI001921842D|nr:proline-rich proteoglycan 2-like [Hyaena hyaena]
MPGCTGDPETVAARSYVARQAEGAFLLSRCPELQRLPFAGTAVQSGACEALSERQLTPHTHPPLARCVTLGESHNVSVPEAPTPVLWRTTPLGVHHVPRSGPPRACPHSPPPCGSRCGETPARPTPSFPLPPSTPFLKRPRRDPEKPPLTPRAGSCEAPEANSGPESLPRRWDGGSGSGAGSPAPPEPQGARDPHARRVWSRSLPGARCPLGFPDGGGGAERPGDPRAAGC